MLSLGSKALNILTFLQLCLALRSESVVDYRPGEVKVNPLELILSPAFRITKFCQTRRYYWEVQNKTAAFDGYTRPVLVINGQFPGPLIEANECDTLEIDIRNELDEEVSIHWHGIFQNGTPWMDGVTGVTQCAIPPKTKFTYKFSINNQFGTFWYHAHSGNMVADGLAGPLIVHSPRDPLKRGIHYDHDIIFLINDWYHDLSTVIANALLSDTGYHGSPAAPSPSSALINGIGFFNCSFAPAGSQCNTPTKFLQLNVGPNQKTRIRIVQAGSHAMFRFSADEHVLDVVEADTCGVQGPPGIHRVPLHNGQRHSVILDTSQDKVGSSFLIRAAMDLDCLPTLEPGLTGDAQTAKVVVLVSNTKVLKTTRTTYLPKTKDWGDPLGGPCVGKSLGNIPRRMALPWANGALCSGETPENMNDTEPGRRRARRMSKSSALTNMHHF